MGGWSRFIVRDALIIGGTLLLWAVDAGLRAAASGWVGVVVAGGAGLMAVVCGFLVHEWGHLAGARLARSVVHVPESLAAVFLFNFDSDRNGRREFLAMSLGGFAASALMIVLLVAVLPLDALSGRVALTGIVLGVIATMVLEVPVAWQVARGAPLPRGGVYRSSTDGEVPDGQS